MSDDHRSHAEGDRQDAETNRIAAEGNRMTAEDARVVTDKGRAEHETARAMHRRRLSLAQVGAYLLIVSVGMFAFYQSDQTQDELCRTTIENRVAIRGLVTEISALGSALVLDGPVEPTDIRALQMFREFEKTQLTALSIPVCDGQPRRTED